VRLALLLFPFFTMSIAVSAVLKPSRRLRALLALYGLANVAAALAVGVVLPGRFAGAPFSVLFFLAAAACLLHGCSAPTKMRRIDISGLGRVRLTVQQDMGADAAGAAPAPAGEQVELLAGTTRWPQLLLLRLQNEEGAVRLPPILHDSVAPGVFRALAVAVAVAVAGGSNDPLQGRHKKL
jgi:toxin CptA